MTDDALLLRRYALEGSEPAFQELVQRHLPLVYSAARRQVGGDVHLAEDIAQSVFGELARAAVKLSPETVVAGWLHRTTRFVAAKTVRTEARRRAREAAAALEQDSPAAMDLSLNDCPPDWDALCLHLDAALDKLSETDRDAILLRFFQGLDFRAVGAALNVSDDTAQKRVTRALERLRGLLEQRDVALPAAVLAAWIASNAVAAPPAGLAAAIAGSIKCATVSGAAVSTGFFLKLGGALLRPKWVSTSAGIAVAGAVLAIWMLNHRPPPIVTYDLSRDFPTTVGTQREWSFGWTPTLGGAFTRLSHKKEFLSHNGEPVLTWQIGDLERPAVGRNMGAGVAISPDGTFVAPPGTIWFGAETNESAHNFAVIRFTVPPHAPGNYRVTTAVHSAFEGRSSGDTDFHILKNGAELFGRFLNPNSGTSYSEVVKLVAGDTIDFVTGRGRNQTDEGSALRIRATLTTDLSAPKGNLKRGFALAPALVSMPRDQGEPAGSAVAFTVVAGGSPPLHYQWWFAGSPISGANDSVLQLPELRQDQAGEYFVMVSNALGVVTSAVARLQIATCAPVSDGLIGWWSAEGTASDRFGGQHGTRSPGTLFAPGKVGRAFRFQGEDAGVHVPASIALDVGSDGRFTCEAWINPDSVAGKLPLIGWNSDTAYGVNLSIVEGRLYANLRDQSGVSHRAFSEPGMVVAGQWQHVALIYDAQERKVRLYCNGKVVAEKFTEAFFPNTQCDLQFGRRCEGATTFTYAGLLDEICLYRRALRPEEISAIASAGSAGKCVSRATASLPPGSK